MRTLLFAVLAVYVIMLAYACNRSKATVSFNLENLSTFTVEIDVARDTVIRAPGGSLLHIPANALDAGGETHVKLLIKEALTMGDIIRAGLVTRTNGQLLSSGGMIDIEPASGQNVTIQKPICVSLPTPFLNKDMELYKGTLDKQGKLNWSNPTPLSMNAQVSVLDSGKSLFLTNCTACHGIDKKVLGPNLAYIDNRRDRKWLYAFTRNNQKLLKSGDPYAHFLYCEYNMTPMTVFPRMTDREIDQIYAYIDNDCAARGVPFEDDHFREHVDSCLFYNRMADSLETLMARQFSANNAQERVQVEARMPAGYVSPDTGTIPKVSPPSYPTLYYQFNITKFGWYNIDILLQKMTGVKNSQLMVKLNGAYASEMNVFLIIPEARVFDNGGVLSTGPNDYGFYTEDGWTPLLQGAKAYVLAMGEQDGKAIFSMKDFQTTENQTIQLEPLPIEKDTLNTKLDMLNLQQIKMQLKDMPVGDSLRLERVTLESIKRLRPKNCFCDAGPKIADSVEVR